MRILLLLISLLISQISFGQKTIEKMAHKLCKHIEKNQVTNVEGMSTYFEFLLLDNAKKIMKEQNLNSISEIDGEAFGIKLVNELYKNCPYFKETVLKQMKDSIKSPQQADENLECEGIQLGDYYYLEPNAKGEMVDTTYVTFTETDYFERLHGGKTYSWLKVQWKDNCNFTLKFVDSNDPLKGNFHTKGDLFDYEVTQNNETYMTIVLHKEGMQYEGKFFKIKKVYSIFEQQ